MGCVLRLSQSSGLSLGFREVPLSACNPERGTPLLESSGLGISAISCKNELEVCLTSHKIAVGMEDKALSHNLYPSHECTHPGGGRLLVQFPLLSDEQRGFE